MNWSENVVCPPLPIAPSAWDPRQRAYPFGDIIADVEDGCVKSPIEVTDSAVTFYGQMGGVKENGVNGCQIDDMLTFALGTLQAMNKKYPCRENSLAITKLEECLLWLDARRKERERRRAEGWSAP